MRLTSFFVRNYQLTLVLFLMIIAVSFTTLTSMPRSEDPEINPPQFPVVALYPGTSPRDMEELVVKPIEKKISELEDLKTIKTTIEDGVAVMEVEYNYNSDVEAKYQELVREVNALRPELPEDMHSIEIRKVTPTDVNILQLALVSENASYARLKIAATELKEELEKVKGLKKVEYWGVPEQVIRVDLQLDRLAELRLPLDAVWGSIRSEAANIPAGSIRAGTKSFNLKTSGKYKSLDEIRNTVVGGRGGKIITLADVADISLSEGELKHITRLNGHRAVLLTAALKSGENISATREAYLPLIRAFEKKLPPNIELNNHFDQAENVSRRLGGLAVDFAIAIGLVLITLLPLGGRSSLIVMVAIPLSLGLGIVALNAMGFSLNQLSIVGLVVALGLLVDDSIVVVENIERWLREGHKPAYAAIEATKQITLAVIGCTATLIIAFLPLVFLPEASGEFIRGLPMAIIATVLASMIVSLTIVPFLASKVLKAPHNPEGNFFMRALRRGISGTYSRILDLALARPGATLVLAGIIFAASLFVFGQTGFRLFPTSEKPQFMVNIHMPLQSNLEETDRVTRQAEKILLQEQEVTYITSNIGKGNPRIYYNVIPENEKSDYAQIFVQLQREVSPGRKKKIIESLRVQFDRMPGPRIEVTDFEQGPPIEAPVALRILGEDLDTLRVLAGRAERILRETPGAIYVRNDVDLLKSDLKLRIQTEKSRSLGIQTADIDRTVRLAVSGMEAGTFTDEKGDDYEILVQAPRERYATLKSLEGIYVNNVAGAPVPLQQFSELSFETSPTRIKHLDKKRYVMVTAYNDKGYLAEQITKRLEEQMNTLALPAGYSWQLAGEAESEQEAFGSGFLNVILATVFLFIMVLLLEFKTFKSTLIVLSVIPLGIIGGVLALWATGNPMSFVAIIGFIGLAGIEVKNSILLVDFTNQLRAEGKSLEEAIRLAGEIRFLPIILTSMTAIGGLLPIAMNSNPLISPLAWVLIGGLLSSTILSRIITPVVYKLIPPKV